MKALHRQMKEKSIKTRQGCFSLLTELIHVLPGALATHMDLIVPGIQFSLGNNQSNSNMKIDTLSFIQCLLTGHHPTVFHPHAQVLVPAIITAVSDTFYKISSEALVVLQLLVKVLRPLNSSPTTFESLHKQHLPVLLRQTEGMFVCVLLDLTNFVPCRPRISTRK